MGPPSVRAVSTLTRSFLQCPLLHLLWFPSGCPYSVTPKCSDTTAWYSQTPGLISVTWWHHPGLQPTFSVDRRRICASIFSLCLST